MGLAGLVALCAGAGAIIPHAARFATFDRTGALDILSRFKPNFKESSPFRDFTTRVYVNCRLSLESNDAYAFAQVEGMTITLFIGTLCEDIFTLRAVAWMQDYPLQQRMIALCSFQAWHMRTFDSGGLKGDLIDPSDSNAWRNINV